MISMHVLASLRPGINCQPKPGLRQAATMDEIQWDAPLPEDFEPPTQQQYDAEVARLANPPANAEAQTKAVDEAHRDRLRKKLGEGATADEKIAGIVAYLKEA